MPEQQAKHEDKVDGLFRGRVLARVLAEDLSKVNGGLTLGDDSRPDPAPRPSLKGSDFPYIMTLVATCAPQGYDVGHD